MSSRTARRRSKRSRSTSCHDSASTRDRTYDFKFHLTERNLLFVAFACIPGFLAYRVVIRRILGLVLGSIRGHYRVAGLRAVGGFAVRLPRGLRKRGFLRRNRRIGHDQILAFGRNEATFFDPVRYQAINPAAAMAFARARKAQGNSPITQENSLSVLNE